MGSATPGQSHLSMEKVRREGERSVILKVGTARSGLFSTDQGRMFKQLVTDCVFIIKDSKKLSNGIRITKACRSAGFMRRVSIGQYFKTIHDVDDGFGGTTEACREHTLLRDHQDSELFWMDRWTHPNRSSSSSQNHLLG